MSSLPLWGYGVVLVGSLVLSLVLVPVALAVAVRFGVLDHPGPAKGHTKAVPYLGGAAIVVAFAAVVLVGNALDPPPSGLPQLAGFLGLGVLLALVGLVDDLRGGLSPLLRLVLEAGAAVAVWAMGSDAHLAGVPSAVDALVSVVWIVGVTNAFNLLDNMDGLSAGTAIIAALSIFGIALLQQRYLVAALALALAGCATGFLRANFHPAKIYMGDAGSLFLGFVLAVLLLKLRATAPNSRPRGGDPGRPRRSPLRHHARCRLQDGPPAQSFRGRPGPHQPSPREDGTFGPGCRRDHLRRRSGAGRVSAAHVPARLFCTHCRRRRPAGGCGCRGRASGPRACLRRATASGVFR